MSTNLIVNGVGFAFPDTGDQNWGPAVSGWAAAVTSGMLQRAGGNFTLSAEVNFGGSHGLVALYLKSRATNLASTGVIRLGKDDAIVWRNEANDGDCPLAVNSSDQLTYKGNPLAGAVALTADRAVQTSGAGVLETSSVTSTELGYVSGVTSAIQTQLDAKPNSGSIVNADINAAAAIAYSKLALTDSIVNADINSAAAIAYSKLSLSDSIVNADINSAAAIAYSKLSLANSIVDADIAAAAAIAGTKISPDFGSQNVVTTGTLGAGATTVGDASTSKLRLRDSSTGFIDHKAPSTVTNDQVLQWPAVLPSVGQAPVVTGVSGSDVTLEWGEAGGGGAINYITEADVTSDFEGNNVTGWNRYANATPAATPEENAAGTPDAGVTFAATSSTPLIGSFSGLLSKNAADQRGEGIRTDWLTIDNAYTDQFLNGSFIVETGGSYAEGDLTVWVEADLGSSTYEIIPTTLRDVGAGKYEHIFTFDTRAVLAYRLILHIATTNPSAWTAKIDQVFVGKRDGAIGILDRDEEEITGTTSGALSQPFTLRVKRVGKVAVATIYCTHGTAAANSAITIPAGTLPTKYYPDFGTGDRINLQATVTAAGTILNGFATVLNTGSLQFFKPDITNYSGTSGIASATGRPVTLVWNIADANYSPAANIDLVQTPSPFEEVTVTGTTSGAIAVPYTLKMRRVANFVLASAFSDAATASAANTINLTGAVPSNLRPETSQPITTSVVRSAGGTVSGFVEITASDGTIRFYKGDITNFSGSSSISSVGGRATSFMWRIRDAEGYSDFFNQVYAALPQRDYAVAPADLTGIANATNTTIPGSSLYLPKGRYVVTATGLAGVSGTAITRTDYRISAIDESGAAIHPANSGGVFVHSSSVQTSFPDHREAIFETSGETIQLQARINAVASSVTDRNVSGLLLRATRLPD